MAEASEELSLDAAQISNPSVGVESEVREAEALEQSPVKQNQQKNIPQQLTADQTQYTPAQQLSKMDSSRSRYAILGEFSKRLEEVCGECYFDSSDSEVEKGPAAIERANQSQTQQLDLKLDQAFGDVLSDQEVSQELTKSETTNMKKIKPQGEKATSTSSPEERQARFKMARQLLSLSQLEQREGSVMNSEDRRKNDKLKAELFLERMIAYEEGKKKRREEIEAQKKAMEEQQLKTVFKLSQGTKKMLASRGSDVPLYKRAVEIANKKKEAAEAAAKALLEQKAREEEELLQTVRKKHSKTSNPQFYAGVQSYMRKKVEEVEQKQKKIKNEEMEPCTFRPQVSKRSMKLVQRREKAPKTELRPEVPTALEQLWRQSSEPESQVLRRVQPGDEFIRMVQEQQ